MSQPVKGKADFLDLGNWNAVCYQCGRKRKASTLLRYWQGYYVCPEHWEIRQPQDFVRPVADVQTPPWTQPMPAGIFVYVCDPEGQTGIVGYATVGCAIVDYISPAFDPQYPGFPFPETDSLGT